MCDVGSVLAIGGLGTSVAGRLAQGGAEVDNAIAKAKYSMLQGQMYGAEADAALGNLDLLRTQAQIAHGNVDIAQAKGRLNESRVADAGEKVLTGQKVSFAGRHIDPTYGSPLVMAAKTAGDIETDMGLVRAGTAIEVAGALTGVANIQQQALGQANAAVTARGNAVLSIMNAGMSLQNADAAGRSMIYGVATTMLTGGAKIWNDWESKVTKAVAGG
jgi:hypothetical protein